MTITNAVPLTLTPSITDDNLPTIFADLVIGDTFDFIRDGAHDNSFYATCRKVSPRCYEYSSNSDAFGEARIVRNRIGSVRAKVYHVNMGEVR